MHVLVRGRYCRRVQIGGMMGQTFEYPNLISGTRSASVHKETYGQKQDESQPWDLHNASKTQENFLWPSVNIPLKPDTDYTLSVWMDRTDNMSSSDIFIVAFHSGGGYVAPGSLQRLKVPAGVGKYISWTFSLSYEPKEDTRYGIRFDNNSSTDGKDSILRVRDVMLVDGTTARAWAPAAGEVWPE